MLHRYAVFCAACFCAIGATLFAQGTTSIIEVHLSDPDCKTVQNVVLVIDDRDRSVISGPKKVGDCTWRFDVGEENQFRTTRTHFSLRMPGMARTTCRLSKWDTKGFARIDFIPLAPVQQITITPTPPLDLIYMRSLRPRHTDDVPCSEVGILNEGLKPWRVADVNFTHEVLRLPYLENEKDICGLVVNSIRAMEKAAKNARGHIALSSGEIVQALASQRKGAQPCQVPNLSGAAIAISEVNLARRPLKQVSIGWE
jgi:hypothetical protein